MSEFVTRVNNYLETQNIEIDYHTDSYVMVSDDLTLSQLGRLYEAFQHSFNIKIEFIGTGLQYGYKIYEG